MFGCIVLPIAIKFYWFMAISFVFSCKFYCYIFIFIFHLIQYFTMSHFSPRIISPLSPMTSFLNDYQHWHFLLQAYNIIHYVYEARNLKFKHHGRAVILYNENFQSQTHLPTRKNAGTDATVISLLLKQYKFEVKTHSNKSRKVCILVYIYIIKFGVNVRA